VAPSACRARRRPVKLATSPLENLLIEHPSMSVYHHSITEDSQEMSDDTETSNASEVSLQLEKKIIRRKDTHVKKRDLILPSVSSAPPQLKNNKSPFEGALRGERMVYRRERSGKTQLDRLNRTRSSTGHHKLRRSDRQQSAKNSFANNNRKCSQRCIQRL